MKLLWLVYYQWRWQAFSPDPFTYTYCMDNAKCIARIRSDTILFQNVIQLQANRENYDTEIFEQA